MDEGLNHIIAELKTGADNKGRDSDDRGRPMIIEQPKLVDGPTDMGPLPGSITEWIQITGGLESAYYDIHVELSNEPGKTYFLGRLHGVDPVIYPFQSITRRDMIAPKIVVTPSEPVTIGLDGD